MFSRGRTIKLQPCSVKSITENHSMKSPISTDLDTSPKKCEFFRPGSLGEKPPSQKLANLFPMDEFLGRTAELDESNPYYMGDLILGHLMKHPRTETPNRRVSPSTSLINYIPTLQVSPRMPGRSQAGKSKLSLRGSNKLICKSKPPAEQGNPVPQQLKFIFPLSVCLQESKAGPQQLRVPSLRKIEGGSSRLIQEAAASSRTSQALNPQTEISGECCTSRGSIHLNSKRGSLSKLTKPSGDESIDACESPYSAEVSRKYGSERGSFRLNPLALPPTASANTITIRGRKGLTVVSVKRVRTYRLDQDDDDLDPSICQSLSPSRTLQTSQDMSPREATASPTNSKGNLANPRLSLLRTLQSVRK